MQEVYKTIMYPYDNTTQRLSLPTEKILTDLEDTDRWYSRKESVIYVCQAVVIAAIILGISSIFIYSVIKAILLDMIATGISTYTIIAPAVLLVIIGYWIRGRHNE